MSAPKAARRHNLKANPDVRLDRCKGCRQRRMVIDDPKAYDDGYCATCYAAGKADQ